MPANEVSVSVLPLVMVLVPLVCGVAVLLAGLFSEKAARIFYIAAAVGPALLTPPVLRAVLGGKTLFLQFATVLPPAGLSFRVDYLSLFMSLLFCIYAVILFVYTLEYKKDRPDRIRFWGCMALTLAGCLGVVLAGDLFTLFLFFEFMSVTFFILIGQQQSPAAGAAALKFLFMTIIAGVSLFLALVLTYQQTGSVAFGQGGLFAPGTVPTLTAFCGFMVAFGIKSAMFPLHLWMPDAYTAAPIPAAALSSGMLLKTGVYGIIRVFYDIYGLEMLQGLRWNYVILGLACITILYGSLNAVAQDDLHRRLAYSGIAQIGYILLGISLLTENAFTGNIYHIFAHAFMKGCLFLCAGAILLGTGKRKVSELSGVGLQMPVTMLAFTIASLTAVGLPPLNVFVTKWFLGQGALDIGQPLLIVLLLLSSILNAAYYLPIVITAFLGDKALAQHKISRRVRIKEASPALLVPIILLMLGCVIFTVGPHNWPLELAQLVAHSIFTIAP
ncbi:MAG: proton-conducting transporter membrane subunit [Bacillota bacterium]